MTKSIAVNRYWLFPTYLAAVMRSLKSVGSSASDAGDAAEAGEFDIRFVGSKPAYVESSKLVSFNERLLLSQNALFASTPEGSRTVPVHRVGRKDFFADIDGIHVPVVLSTGYRKLAD